MYFLSKLHNNSILTGSADSYCLVCENYLRSEDEAFLHTDKPIHKKNITAATVSENYKDDKIIKVKKGYYCTFCNILLSTTTKVRLHVSDTKHKENKGAQMLSQVGDNIVAFNEIIISREAWHGLMENTCILCNEEFDNVIVHRSEQSHILKLIQSKCDFGEKIVYRQVDEDSFFCLICGIVYAIAEKPNHHENMKHKEMYDAGKELKDKMTITAQTQLPKVSEVTSLVQTLTNKNDDADKKTKAMDVKTNPDSIKETNNNESNAKDVMITKNDDNLKLQAANGVDTVAKYAKKAKELPVKKTHDSIIATSPSRNKSEHSNDNSANLIGMDKDHKIPANGVGTVTKIDESAQAIPVKTPHGSHKVISHNAAESSVNDNGVSVAKAGKKNKAVNVKIAKEEKSTIIDMVDKFQKNHINIDLTSERAICKHCNKDVPYDFASIKKHIAVHMEEKSKVKVKELETFAKENKIEVQENKAYCKLCSTRVNLQMNDIVAHINSISHKNNILDETDTGIKKVTAADYTNLFYQVESNLGSDVILNNAYMLRYHSFHCVVLGEETWTCMLCNVQNDSRDKLLQHINSAEHKCKISYCNVVVSLPNEFVRQISPEVYHCGYCNETAEKWCGIQAHLLEPSHVTARHHAMWNLERCHTITRSARPQQVSSMQEISYQSTN